MESQNSDLMTQAITQSALQPIEPQTQAKNPPKLNTDLNVETHAGDLEYSKLIFKPGSRGVKDSQVRHLKYTPIC